MLPLRAERSPEGRRTRTRSRPPTGSSVTLLTGKQLPPTSTLKRVDLGCNVRKKRAYLFRVQAPGVLMKYLLVSNESFGLTIIRRV